MLLTDRYDLPLATTSTAAADAYLRATDNLLAAGADLLAGFETALSFDEGFALAEIGRARCLATYGRGTAAKASAARARELVQGASRREISHVDALALVIEGRGAEALVAIKAHLAQFPRDALVLQPATGIFGLIGFSGRREREAEMLALLEPMARHFGDDAWFLAVHAFAECEVGRLDEAERRVLRALELAPYNANAAHVRAHVCYELDQPEAGADFLRAWLPTYAPAGLLRGHLSWHLALWELSLGNAATAQQLYATQIGACLQGGGPPTPPLNVLTDGVSWLWRAQLRGEASDAADWQRLARYATERFAQAGVAFGDAHAALAFAHTGNSAALERLSGQLAQLGLERPASAVAQRLAAGFAAYARQDWARAAELLGTDREELVRIGGSKAQRELVDRTLLDALSRAGLVAQVQALQAARPQLPGGA